MSRLLSEASGAWGSRPCQTTSISVVAPDRLAAMADEIGEQERALAAGEHVGRLGVVDADAQRPAEPDPHRVACVRDAHQSGERHQASQGALQQLQPMICEGRAAEHRRHVLPDSLGHRCSSRRRVAATASPGSAWLRLRPAHPHGVPRAPAAARRTPTTSARRPG